MKEKGPLPTSDNQYKNLFNSLRYGINLAWINQKRDEQGHYVCVGKTREAMDEILKQLKKWRIANPEAEINFWYDSECTNGAAIENTKKCLEEVSGTEYIPINLRDIREIPIVQANSDLFQSSIPIYFRVDLLKLIICLYLLENKGMDSAIFTDLSIGANVETVLSKEELYSPDKLNTLQQYGMLLGEDLRKIENQFIQTLKTEELILSIKHTINCCLYLATDKLNEAVQKNAPQLTAKLHDLPCYATLNHIHMYLLVLQSKKPVKIRADMVNEGDNTQWVDYNPERHRYVMFGNYFHSHSCSTTIFLQKDSQKFTSFLNCVKLPESLKHIVISPGSIVEENFYEKVSRTDLNPSKTGSDHMWLGELSHPTQGDVFHCTPWPQENPSITKTVESIPRNPKTVAVKTDQPEPEKMKQAELDQLEQSHKIKVKKLIQLCKLYKKHLESSLSKSKKAIKKYKIVEAMHRILINSDIDDETKIENIKKILTEENKAILTSHRDSSIGEKFLEAVFHILTLGIYSKIDKGTFAFWKSHGEILVEDVTKAIDKPNLLRTINLSYAP